MIQADIATLLPEVILALFAMGALIGAVYTGKDKTAPLVLWLTSILFVFLAIWIGFGGSGTQTAFGGAFIDDSFSRFAKVTILLSAAAILLLSQDYMTRNDLMRFEYPLLVALAVVGMMMMVSAHIAS